MFALVAFVLGFIAGGAWVCYVKQVPRSRWRAALSDAVIVAPALATYQFWAEAGNDWRVLAAYGIGSVMATFLFSAGKTHA